MAKKQTTDADTLEPVRQTRRMIYIRAESIQAFGGGLFVVEVKAESMSPDEYDVIDQLFPNTRTRLDELLSTEALISAQDIPLSGVELKSTASLDRDGNNILGRYSS